jgi:DNA primase
MSIASSDLVTLAANYITLKESRRTFRGNCPFHQDKTGSLMISPEKNIFKCFGCGKEGGPDEFISGMAALGFIHE